MDLKKTPDVEKVRLSKIYFRVGFAFLPFLWLVNVVWFFREAFLRDNFEGQQEVKKNVIKSAIGASVWIIGLSVWISLYQMNRASWGATGDAISYLIPLGEP